MTSGEPNPPDVKGKKEERPVRPGGQSESRKIHPISCALVGAKVAWGEEHAAGDVVKYREPERVEGAEAQSWCRWTTLCRFVNRPDCAEGLVRCA